MKIPAMALTLGLTAGVPTWVGAQTATDVDNQVTTLNSSASSSGQTHVIVGQGSALAKDDKRPARFLAEERRIIEQYYRAGQRVKHKGLPPGLAKRGGGLPPGLQKQLDRNGRLPPGLQKRLEPLPVNLNSRLPSLPEYLERVILERDVILIDNRTNRILDIIEDVVGLATGR